jgi:hypothetical protein
MKRLIELPSDVLLQVFGECRVNATLWLF